MRFRIMGSVPSVNALYQIDRKSGHIYLNPKGRKYKDVVSEFIRLKEWQLPDELRHIRLQMRVTSYFRRLWDEPGKRPTCRDDDNPVKPVRDAVCRGLRFDDAWIWRTISTKRLADNSNECVVVTIEPYVDDEED